MIIATVDTLPFANEIGLVAPLCLLSGYFLLNIGKLTADSYIYQWLNVIGAAALTYTVISPMNIGVLITEVIWTFIGIFGLIKIYRTRKAGPVETPNA